MVPVLVTGLTTTAFLSHPRRTVSSGSVLYVALIAGSIVLLFGARAGLYIAASAMVVLTVYSVSGAWLLLVGAHELPNDEGAS